MKGWESMRFIREPTGFSQLWVRIPNDLLDRLVTYCIHSDRKMSETVCEALQRFLEGDRESS